jgi:FMN phosphatase YigB (HAD superfamily)
MISNIFLDYGGLIVDYQFTPETLSKAHKLALRDINRHSTRKVELSELADAHDKVIKEYLQRRNKNNSETTLAYMVQDMLSNHLFVGSDLSSTITGIYERNDHTVALMPTTMESIPELQKFGQLGIITNLPHSSYRLELARFGLENVFNPIVSSWEAGFRKPHPRIYELTLNRVKINPEDAIFFSHDQEEVDGALAVGMQAHLAKNLAEVLNKLTTS